MRDVNFTTHYPQGNGQAEFTNKVFGILLTKLVKIKQIGMDIYL
jgi:hypothetical protein